MACNVKQILEDLGLEVTPGSVVGKAVQQAVNIGESFKDERQEYLFAQDGILGQEKYDANTSPTELTENQLEASVDAKAREVANNPNQVWADESVIEDRKSTKDYTVHSGGALGADTIFGDVAKSLGMRVHHYYIQQKKYDTHKINGKDVSIRPPNANTPLTKSEFYEANLAASKAAQEMGKVDGNNKIRNKLVLRNWNQVKYADTVYAIAEKIIPLGGKLQYNKTAKQTQVSGGTGYAVHMAVNEGKPTYVYDMSSDSWYKAVRSDDGIDVSFLKMTGIPLMDSKNFAGIGTRKAQSSAKAKKAVSDLLSQASVKSHKDQDTINEIKVFGKKANTSGRVTSKGKADKTKPYIGGVGYDSPKYAQERGLTEYENFSNPFVESSVEQDLNDNQVQLKTDKAGSVVAYYEWLKTGKLPTAKKAYTKDQKDFLSARREYILANIESVAKAKEVVSLSKNPSSGEYGISNEMALLSFAMEHTNIAPPTVTIDKDGKEINIKEDEVTEENETILNTLLDSNEEFRKTGGKSVEDKFVTVPDGKTALPKEKGKTPTKITIARDISNLKADVLTNKNTDYYITHKGSSLESMKLEDIVSKLESILMLPNVKFSKEFEDALGEKYIEGVKEAEKKAKEKKDNKKTVVTKSGTLNTNKKLFSFTYKFKNSYGKMTSKEFKKTSIQEAYKYVLKFAKNNDKASVQHAVMKKMIKAAYYSNKAYKKAIDEANGNIVYKLDKNNTWNKVKQDAMNALSKKTKTKEQTQTENVIEKDDQTNRDVYTGVIVPGDNVVFVYGANTEARHGLGAAKTAKEKFGADYKNTDSLEKLTGNSYGIVTKDLTLPKDKQLKGIPEKDITASISKMYTNALANPDKTFMIAYSGDGQLLNGYSNEEMAKMFKNAGKIPDNVVFEKDFNAMVFNTKQEGTPFEDDNVLSLDEKNKTLLAPALTPKAANSDIVQAELNNGFTEKKEYHVTALGFKQGEQLKKIFEKNPEKEAEVQDLINRSDFSYTENGDVVKIERDLIVYKDWKTKTGKSTRHDEAIIVKVEAPGVKKFIEELNTMLGTDFPVPYPHISLATIGSPLGIAVANEEALQKLKPKVLNQTDTDANNDILDENDIKTSKETDELIRKNQREC